MISTGDTTLPRIMRVNSVAGVKQSSSWFIFFAAPMEDGGLVGAPRFRLAAV
jgi:hypothetical protein